VAGIEPDPDAVPGVVREQRIPPHLGEPGSFKGEANDLRDSVSQKPLIRVGIAPELLGVDHENPAVRRQLRPPVTGKIRHVDQATGALRTARS
jgi:hypothetical protein